MTSIVLYIQTAYNYNTLSFYNDHFMYTFAVKDHQLIVITVLISCTQRHRPHSISSHVYQLQFRL